MLLINQSSISVFFYSVLSLAPLASSGLLCALLLVKLFLDCTILEERVLESLNRVKSILGIEKHELSDQVGEGGHSILVLKS